MRPAPLRIHQPIVSEHRTNETTSTPSTPSESRPKLGRASEFRPFPGQPRPWSRRVGRGAALALGSRM